MTADILTRLQQANGPDTALDDAICIALQYAGKDAPNPQNVRVDPDDLGWLLYEMDGEAYCDSTPSLTESIDASLALVERKLPGWGGIISLGSGSSIHVADLWSEARGNQNTEDEEENPLIGEDAHGEHASLPIAILIALFTALQETDNDHG